MARTLPPGETPRGNLDDYLVDRDAQAPARPVAARLLQVVNFVLLVILAAVSLAVFLVIATLIGII